MRATYIILYPIAIFSMLESSILEKSYRYWPRQDTADTSYESENGKYNWRQERVVLRYDCDELVPNGCKATVAQGPTTSVSKQHNDLCDTTSYPSAKNPNNKEKMTSTLRLVAKPQSRKQLSAAPRQEIVTTVRVGHLSLRWPRTSKPTTDEALHRLVT